jgi:hypothetical protein
MSVTAGVQIARLLNDALQTMADSIRVTTELGPTAGMEFIADYLNNTDAFDDDDPPTPEDWLTKWGPVTSHTTWSGWPER